MTGDDILGRLGAFGTDGADRPALAEAAMLLGALERPRLPLDRYHRHLETLVDKIGAYARVGDGPVPVAVMAEALKQVLARQMGYGGGADGGRDEDCFDLTRVIDSRNGAGEALSILYADVGRRLDWQVDIVEVPGRVLVRVEALGERLLIDPQGNGRVVDIADLRAIVKAFGGIDAELRPDGLDVLDDRRALLRLLAGRKAMLLHTKRLDEAARIIELSLMISPGEPALWRECGLLNARLDRIRDAIDALEEYLRLGADEQARYRTSILLQELRGRLN